MEPDQPPAPGNGTVKSLVAMSFPEGRELLWVARDSPIVGWQVDDAVIFRNNRWRVLQRSEQADTLSLTLGPPD